MPFKDGTGPDGSGPRTMGTGRRGRQGGAAAGPAGYCVCPSCGERILHTTGVPCTSVSCPKCNTKMLREV
ncbi:MAG: hypothetical protein QM215_04860 [Bacillota bacterium]|nr:hypothetical protein [Eubacteriales bacterium]MDI9492241.1 hypothetical protein [Bacillota bacterium]NLV70413.1 DUF5320 domain-containing protein [Clostridiales bacterium]HRV33570.1 hypothetical protein [Anaerovoracaceae bacterium]MDD3536648.1 hypothetical protein [Eubacteriales bacterium]